MNPTKNTEQPAQDSAPSTAAARNPLAIRNYRAVWRQEVLPGEDAAAYQRLREDLFHQHIPRNCEEEHSIDSIASHLWRIARYRRWQEAHETWLEKALQAGELPPGSKALKDALCMSKDLKKSLKMMESMLASNRKELAKLQQWRREGLIGEAGDEELLEMAYAFSTDNSGTGRIITDAPVRGESGPNKRAEQEKLSKLLQTVRSNVGHA